MLSSLHRPTFSRSNVLWEGGYPRYEGKFLVVECIHGLDKAMCDLCTPKPIPKVEQSAPKVVRPRVSAAKARVAGAAGPTVQSVDQRIYHITHLRNLEAIVRSGCLLSDSHGAEPVVDISSASNREERREATVDGAPVAGFVPFFVSPDAVLWRDIRASVPDPRLAPTVRETAPAEYVVLVTTIGKAGRDNSVVATGDATDAGTRFATTPEQATRELGRMRGDEDVLDRAELLVHERLPFDAVTLIGVANDRARNEVRDILAGSEFTTKVSIYPPWFARP
jgi:hypothetical protein